MRRAYHFDHALLPEGWARQVRVTCDDGLIVAVETGAPAAEAERIGGIAVPGLANVHSHAFQRAMAGLAERRGPANDSFWTWREVMYRFLNRLTPDDVEAIAAFLYIEMLERGFTAVGEFHYLHHAPDGSPYADIAEMAARIAAAAAQAGIGLTLLPTFYANGGFGGAAPHDGQRRFITSPDEFAQLVERCHAIAARQPGANVGIAPHSLRAVTPETLAAVLAAARGGPVHMHVAEQTKEVEDCLAWSGQRPAEWLLDHAPVDDNWCFIHATHTLPHEIERLAQAGAVIGLCPLTEASLGDGIFDGPSLLRTGGQFGIGSDSNIEVDAAAELRQFEYSQRLARRGRNILTEREGDSTGRSLVGRALAGGAQALARPMAKLSPGHAADIVVLDDTHPDLGHVAGDRWLDAWIFVAGRAAIASVIASGQRCVAGGEHVARARVTARYRQTMQKLAEA